MKDVAEEEEYRMGKHPRTSLPMMTMMMMIMMVMVIQSERTKCQFSFGNFYLFGESVVVYVKRNLYTFDGEVSKRDTINIPRYIEIG